MDRNRIHFLYTAGEEEMSLLREIAEALGCNHEAVEQDFGCYVVPDLCTVQPAPKTILLLESPHYDEVHAGHPLAGASGKEVTKVLKCNCSIQTMLSQIESANRVSSGNEAIGCILKRCPGTLRLGLMNSIRLPLQIKAYRGSQQYHRRLFGEFLCLLLQTVIRNRSTLLSDEALPRASRIYRVLLNDLKSRLENLPEEALVVPCGEAARDFLEKARSLEGYQGAARIYDQEIPHPARGHWKRNASNDCVQSLVNVIHDRSLAHA